MSNPCTAPSTRLTAATARAKKMLAAAPEPDLRAMETIRRRLVAHEAELLRTWPSPRRRELDELVFADLETLCEGFVKLERAAERAEPTEA
jgi:hypothetical protein